MNVALDDSRRYCRSVARRRAKNFYYAFALLPRQKRDALCAVYAFMRHSDDLSDEPDAPPEALKHWRAALEAALAGRPDGRHIWPALLDALARYRIPHQYLFDMVEGVASDLAPRAIATFDELYHYCYRVASVAGLSMVHILGFDSPQALELAEKCGVAFQLTNILRDVREDSERGRVYLPAEDLARFGVRAEDLRRGEGGDNLTALFRFEAARARAYYRESWPLLRMVHPSGRASLRALIEIYSRLLERIEQSGFDVFSRRISLSGVEKCWIALGALARA